MATEKKFGGVQKRSLSIVIKVVGANVINVILLVVVLYLLSQLTQVAGKIKELRSAQLAAEETTDAAVIKAEVDKNADKVGELTSLRAGDQEFIDFIEAVSALKSKGVIADVQYPGTTVGHDKIAPMDGKGFPVLIVLRGSQDQINTGLARVLDLPFLFLPQDVEFDTVGEEGGVPGMKLNVLLVVNENFAEN